MEVLDEGSSRVDGVWSDLPSSLEQKPDFGFVMRLGLLASVFLDFLFCSVELVLNRLPFCPEKEAEMQRLHLGAAVDRLHLKALKMARPDL